MKLFSIVLIFAILLAAWVKTFKEYIVEELPPHYDENEVEREDLKWVDELIDIL